MRWIIGSLVAVNIVVLASQLVLTGGEPNLPAQQTPTIKLGDAPPLTMLHELGSSDLEAMRRDKRIARAGQPSSSSNDALCTLVGPFEKLLPAEYFTERLNALDLQAKVEELEIPGELVYWVYLPSQGTRRQAFNLLRELQAKNIDSYVIPKGELENGISFGMFSQKALAERQLQTMRDQGYAAELKEETRTQKEIWVVLPPGQSSQLSDETWLEMLQEQAGVERRQNFCPTVAS